MEFVFWLSLALLAYVYAGYPLLVAVWAKLADRRPEKAEINSKTGWPAISIVLAARNEAGRLPARVRNLLAVRYPGPREIIVVSDGSTDDPAAALSLFRGEIRLLELPAGGKPAALNAGVAAARGEIIVFADARQTFAENALVELVANFADPAVGGATGQLILDAEHQHVDSSVGEGVGLYWRYEKWMRLNESRVWSTLGATGCIYALRRGLWRPLPSDTLLDDVLAPMRAVLEGTRIVFEERALAFDRASEDASAESRRKVRTLAGNYQILRLEPRLLLPIVNPVWTQYVSHKVARLLVPWALVSALLSAGLLAMDGWFYATAFAVQIGFYSLAAYGAWAEHRSRGAGGFRAAVREVAR